MAALGAIGRNSGPHVGAIVSPLTRVQYKTSVSATDTASQSVTLDAAPTQGNLLVLTACAGATMPTPSGWISRSVTVDFVELEQWTKVAGASESATITVAPSSAAACCMIAEEYSGVAASAFDVQVSASPTTTPATISPGTTGATAQADELGIAAVGYVRVSGASSKTVTAWSNSFVQLVTLEGVSANTNNNVTLVYATKVLRGTGTQTTTATFSAAQDHPSALLTTYKSSRAIAAGTTHQTAAWASSYVTRGRVKPSWQSSYKTRARTRPTWATSYTLRARSTGAWQSSYVARGRVRPTWASSYIVIDHVAVSWQSRYTVIDHTSAAWTSGFTVIAHVRPSWVSSYAVRDRVSATWQSSAIVRTRFGAAWASGYVTHARGLPVWASQWTTRRHATLTWQSRYNTRTRILGTWGTGWTARERDAQTWTSGYTTRSRRAVSWQTRYVVSVHPSVAWQSSYRVRHVTAIGHRTTIDALEQLPSGVVVRGLELVGT